jgi:hypothetical protein
MDENLAYQKLWPVVKTIIERKSIALDAYFEHKHLKSIINFEKPERVN